MSSAALDAPASSKPVRSAHFRTLIALTMLLIASLGAGIAGWAAIKQQSSSNLERRVAQAQMMELADWLKLI